MEHRKPREPDFCPVLEESIEEGLRDVLGESGLEMVVSLHSVEQLALDPRQLHDVLKGIFMENGALIIEKEIARRLLAKMGTKGEQTRRSPRSWIASAVSHANSARRVSDKEKQVLRRFLALACLPVRHEQPVTIQYSRESDLRYLMDATAASFAHAFRNGS